MKLFLLTFVLLPLFFGCTRTPYAQYLTARGQAIHIEDWANPNQPRYDHPVSNP